MTVKQYRKKPVVIEAMQYDGFNSKEIEKWAEESGLNRTVYEFDFEEQGAGYPPVLIVALAIETLEGTMIANVGDWIIKGVAGEFCPYKPDIFEKTYEEVNDE